VSDAPFVARVSRGKALYNLLLTLIGTFGTGFGVVWALAVPGKLLLLLGLCLPFALSLYLVWWIGRALFHQGDALILDREGMHMPGCFEERLPWSAIARAEALKGRLSLWMAPDAAIPAGKEFARIVRRNRAAGRADIVVSMWLTNRSNDELVAAVRSLAPRLFA
jgi:hypothetical protein